MGQCYQLCLTSNRSLNPRMAVFVCRTPVLENETLITLNYHIASPEPLSIGVHPKFGNQALPITCSVADINVREQNKLKCKEILKVIDWDLELGQRTTDKAMQIFYKEFQIAYNKAFPFVKLSRKPWISNALKAMDFKCFEK